MAIDFDDVLGMERSTNNFFAAYQWRFSEKWALGLFYSSMSADGRREAARDFTWNGEEYKAGARVESEFNLDTLLISASYSFARTDNYEWGLGFGLHAFDIETTLDVAVKVDRLFEDARRNNSTVLAPLPNLRAYGTWVITPNWEVGIDVGWLSISYEDYDGDYLFFDARTEYGFSERFGIGFSYQLSEIDVTVDKSRGKDRYDMDFYGPSLYLTYGF